MPAQPIGGRYQTADELVRHGAVTTFTAVDRWLDRRVGLALHDGEDPTDRAQFERATEALAACTSGEVLPLYDLGAEGERRFVTFELPAETLTSRLEDGPMPVEDVARLGVELAALLDELHREGTTHGRLHPGAVGVDASGRPRLAPAPVAPPPDGWGGAMAWTASEQASPGEATVASDVFSLGALLLSGLVGRGPGPLADDATAELATRLRQSSDPQTIEVIAACLAADPTRRPASMGDVAAALAPAAGIAVPAAPPGPAKAPRSVRRRLPRPADVPRVRRPRLSPALLGGVAAAALLAMSLSVVLGGGAPSGPRLSGTGAGSPAPCGADAGTSSAAGCPGGTPSRSTAGSTAPTTAPTLAAATSTTAARRRSGAARRRAGADGSLSPGGTATGGARLSPSAARRRRRADKGAAHRANPPTTTTTTTTATLTTAERTHAARRQRQRRDAVADARTAHLAADARLAGTRRAALAWAARRHAAQVRALSHRAAVHRAAVHRAAVHRAAVHRAAVHRAAVHRALAHRAAARRARERRAARRRAELRRAALRRAASHRAAVRRARARRLALRRAAIRRALRRAAARDRAGQQPAAPPGGGGQIQ